MTRRLYLEDAFLCRFRAEVVSAAPGKGPGGALALDRTAFYPGGGGQPPDHGWIDGRSVARVSTDEGDAGLVWHHLEPTAGGPSLPAPGQEVDCRLDWDHRFDLMQQHTGQHVISAVALGEHGAQTTSFHLTEETATVDLAFPGLAGWDAARVEQALADLQRASCAEVFADRQVRLHLAAPGETPEGLGPELSLRVRQRGPAPRAAGEWRVVEIRGLDLSPCGGTHVRSTGQVGLITFERWERIRDSVRVEFACGWRALEASSRRNRDLKRLGRELSVHEREAVDQAIRALGDAERGARETARLRGALLAYEARELCAQAVEAAGTRGARLVSRAFPDRAPEELKRLALDVAARPGHIALLASGGASPRLVFARAEDVGLDVREPLAAAMDAMGGRGGGQPGIAQGGGGDPAKLHLALDAASARVRAMLAKGCGEDG